MGRAKRGGGIDFLVQCELVVWGGCGWGRSLA